MNLSCFVLDRKKMKFFFKLAVFNLTLKLLYICVDKLCVSVCLLLCIGMCVNEGVQPNRWLFRTVPFERTRPNRPLFTMPSSVRIVVLRCFQFANTCFPIIIEIMAKATIITWVFVAEIYTKSARTFRKFDMATFLICKNIYMYNSTLQRKD